MHEVEGIISDKIYSDGDRIASNAWIISGTPFDTWRQSASNLYPGYPSQQTGSDEYPGGYSGSEQTFDTEKFVDFFKMLVRNENRKNSIREFLSQCLGYIAYQIAEHKGIKGQ